MRLFFTLFEAPWSQWPLHCVYNEKLKKTGPETENGMKLCTSCLNAWNKLPSCQPRSQGSLLSTLRSKERTLGTRLPSCLQQAARLGKQCLLQQTLPCLNSFTFSVKLSRCNASLCTRCFRYFSSFHLFTYRYVYLENHFRARQNRSTGNPTLHQDTSTNVWSALIALRDKSLLSRAAVLFHTKLQLTV